MFSHSQPCIEYFYCGYVARHIDLGTISSFPLTLGGARILYRNQVPKGKLSIFFASKLALKIIFTLEKKNLLGKEKSTAEQVKNKIEQKKLQQSKLRTR